MLTDDADTPGANRWEINAALTVEEESSQRSASFPVLDVNYGIGESVQLKYEIAWQFVRRDGEDWASGLGNSLVGVKWRFVDGGDSGMKVSVYPQYEFENGTDSVERGVAEPGPNFFLPVQVSRSFGRMGLVTEVGYQFRHAEEDEWVFGLLGSLEASDELELLAEIHGTATKHFDDWDPLVNLGLRRKLGDRFKLLASIGTGFGDGSDRTRLVAYLGVQLLLGEERQ